MVGRECPVLALGLCLLALLSGCGDSDPQKRRAVSGVVALDGHPVLNGSIRFQPDAVGGVSSGAVIVSGKYSIPADKGLPTGKYKVLIFAPKPGTGQLPPGAMPGDPLPPAEELIPPQYNVNSSQFVEVTAKGPNAFKFELVTSQ
jgi:hypothetical protein